MSKEREIVLLLYQLLFDEMTRTLSFPTLFRSTFLPSLALTIAPRHIVVAIWSPSLNDLSNFISFIGIEIDNVFKKKSHCVGEFQIPLFVQRTTAHYQLKGQMAVVFQNAVIGNF